MFQVAYNIRNNTASTKLPVLEDQTQDNFEATLPVCVQVNGNVDQQQNWKVDSSFISQVFYVYQILNNIIMKKNRVG